MRGGATAAEQAKPLFDALTEAIETEFTNCTEGIDKALTSKRPEDIILLNKKRILIPILIDDLDAVQQKFPDSSKITDVSLLNLKESLMSNTISKTKTLESQLEKITNSVPNAELPDPIKAIYTSDTISPLSRIKKILALFVIESGKINIEGSIEETIKNANQEYENFLKRVSDAEKGSKPSATSSNTGMSFTATIDKECNFETECIVKVKRGGGRKTRNKKRKGVRKSQNKKILKGGRRRR